MKRSITHALLSAALCLSATSVFGQTITISSSSAIDANGSGNSVLNCSGGPTGFANIWGMSYSTANPNSNATVTVTFNDFPSSFITTSNVRLLRRTLFGSFSNPSSTYTPSSVSGNTATFTGVNASFLSSFAVAFANTNGLYDFGDAPNYYHTTAASAGPRHGFTCSNLYLGSGKGFAADASVYPAKDDNDNAFRNSSYLPELQVGATTYSVTIPLANNTGDQATLAGWVDFNHDSVFQANEAATAIVNNGATTATLNWNMSSVNYVGMTWARFRLSTDPSLTASTPGGIMSDGEVEDYYMWISDNKNCGGYNVTYITSTGTLGSSSISEGGTGGYNDFYTGGSGQNEFGSNNDNNLYYYASGNTFYWYDPISNTQGTLISNVQGLGTTSFSSSASGPLSESAGYYYNGRMYFTLDNVDGSGGSGSRCYYYSVDIAPDGKSIVSGSLMSYGYISGADHGDFIVRQESGLPVIYDMSSGSSMLFRKISDLNSLVGSTSVIPSGNITTLTVNMPSGVAFNNAQMAYNAATSTFYINQSTDLYKVTLSGNTATVTLVRSNAFSSEPYDMGNNLCVADMGDLPSSFNNTLLANNGAQHGSFNTTVKLGTTITADEDGKPSANSDADGGDDGNPTFPTLTATNYTVTIKATKTASGNAYLTAWIDFNNNGVFDANEKSTTTTITATGTNIPVTVSWATVPNGSTILNRFARFRISTNSASVQNAVGYAPDGEVEDYKVTVLGQPLEVSLTSFTAQAQNSSSLLNWATSSEKNSAYFDIEHSTDGRTFAKIGTEKAMGNSELSHNYSFVHRTPANGMNYYRLKMADLDGSFKYSETRTVRFGDLTSGNIAIVPNPTSGATRIVLPAALSENGTVVVYNNMGTVVAKIAAPGMQAIEMDLSSQSAGLYHIVVMDGNNAVYRDKVIKQ